MYWTIGLSSIWTLSSLWVLYNVYSEFLKGNYSTNVKIVSFFVCVSLSPFILGKHLFDVVKHKFDLYYMGRVLKDEKSMKVLAEYINSMPDENEE